MTEVDVLKKIVFMMLIASILVAGLVLPGCAGGGGDGNGNGDGDGDGDGGPDTRPPITFAVAGAMNDVAGRHALWGAELARDEINGGAGVNVGDVCYKIELIQVDTNEVSGTPEEGVAALEAIIDNVDFVLGGWRTANIQVYREVAMDAQKIFMNCGASTGALQGSVVTDYDHYKYWFKVSPYNEFFLTNSLFKMVGQFTDQFRDALIAEGDAVDPAYKVSESDKLRVAIIAEDAVWCTWLVTVFQGKITTLGYDLVGTWLVSPTATDISAELLDIVGKQPHLIMSIFSRPMAVVYSKQRVELGIPAMSIGIKHEGEQKEQWANTEGKCNGEIMLDTWAEGLQNTAKTTTFFDAFVAKTGEYPIYTASTYDAIYQLKEAVEAVSVVHGWSDIADVVNPTNIDSLIQYIETQPYTGTAGKIAYYPMPGITVGGGTYALSETQVRALYPSLVGYEQGQWLVKPTEAMTGSHLAHDTVYGPGYETGIGSQWQDGHKVGVWPVDLGDDYDEALTDQYGCWNFEYPGTVDVVIPIEGFLAS